MTEQGGVRRKSNTVIRNEPDADTTFQSILALPGKVPTANVQRFYAYQWRGNNQYDAGLIHRPAIDDDASQAFYTFRAKSNPNSLAPIP